MKKGAFTVVFITIIFGLLICLWASGFMFGLLESKVPSIFIIVCALVFLALIGALIYSSYERLKEIKEEDKDDISKY